MKGFNPIRDISRCDIRLLRSDRRSGQGFTLIELMIVVMVIGILATVGAVSYKNSTQAGREARSRADVDAIAKAYELSYNAQTAQYRALTDSDFASGKKPDNPKITYTEGPDVSSADNTRFRVCVPLNADPSCDTETDNCYCRSSAQAYVTGSPSVILTPTPRL